jgi:hypothetical protein
MSWIWLSQPAGKRVFIKAAPWFIKVLRWIIA